jgi:hypothetical protein
VALTEKKLDRRVEERLKAEAREVHPSLTIAAYYEHYIEVRVYDYTGEWEQLQVLRSVKDAETYLRGMRGMLRLQEFRVEHQRRNEIGTQA